MAGDGVDGVVLDMAAIQSLEGLVGGDREAFVEIVDAFLEDAPGQIADLGHGAAENDLEVVRRAAHTLKGNAHTFGASTLASLCQEIELAARDGNLEPSRARHGDVDAAWVHVRDELIALRDGGPS